MLPLTKEARDRWLADDESLNAAVEEGLIAGAGSSGDMANASDSTVVESRGRQTTEAAAANQPKRPAVKAGIDNATSHTKKEILDLTPNSNPRKPMIPNHQKQNRPREDPQTFHHRTLTFTLANQSPKLRNLNIPKLSTPKPSPVAIG